MKKVSIFLIVFLTASLAYSQRQAPILIAAGQSKSRLIFDNERSEITENIAPQRGEVINIFMAKLSDEVEPIYINYRILQEADSAKLDYLKRVCPIDLDFVEQLSLKVIIRGIDPRAHSLGRDLKALNEKFWIPEQEGLAWELNGFASRYKPVDKTIEEIKAIEGGAEWLLLTMVLINQDLKLEKKIDEIVNQKYSFKTVVLADIYWLRPYQKRFKVHEVGVGKSMIDCRFNWVYQMKRKLGIIK